MVIGGRAAIHLVDRLAHGHVIGNRETPIVEPSNRVTVRRQVHRLDQGIFDGHLVDLRGTAVATSVPRGAGPRKSMARRNAVRQATGTGSLTSRATLRAQASMTGHSRKSPVGRRSLIAGM